MLHVYKMSSDYAAVQLFSVPRSWTKTLNNWVHVTSALVPLNMSGAQVG